MNSVVNFMRVLVKNIDIMKMTNAVADHVSETNILKEERFVD